MTTLNLPWQAKTFFAAQNINKTNQDILLLFPSEETALKAFTQTKFFANCEVHYLPAFDGQPYDHISPSPKILAARACTLTELAINENSRKRILITNAASLVAKLPPISVFYDNTLLLSKGLNINITDLINFLTNNGFVRSASAIDNGEFAVRGEIIDIVLSDVNAYRIMFNTSYIESIKKYSIDTQLSNNETVNKILISPISEIILNDHSINNFKDKFLVKFGLTYTKSFLYKSISEGRKFPGYEQLIPFFYNITSNLTQYLNDPIIIYDNLSLQIILEHIASYEHFYQERKNNDVTNISNFFPLIPQEELIFSVSELTNLLNKTNNILITGSTDNKSDIQKLDITQYTQGELQNFFNFINTQLSSKIIVIFCKFRSSLENIQNKFTKKNFKLNVINHLSQAKLGIINLAIIEFNTSLFSNKYLFIAANDIIAEKIQIAVESSSKKLKNILLELDSLEPNEYIVHKDYGIGQFLSLENIVTGGMAHDFIKILYAENAKLYIPVENIETIKKYGDINAELDKLGSLNWQKRKAKLKQKVNEIAQRLLQLTAKRKLSVIAPIHINQESYSKFCNSFNFVETQDQLNAIEDIKKDLVSGIIMDRLICGDVGFGKTEVALRAAFLTLDDESADRPQIAIIVPTTLLCKQHYTNFTTRFCGYNFKIMQLSRLIKPIEVKKTKQEIKNGNVDIIIGTHALLSKDIEFKNLKLLIIDEEQHFGVAQKERLKEIRPQTHVLSLSATPIPRTLQMSLVGLKDLSIIATPPVNRLAIRTNVMPYDHVIIKDALLKEHLRGGKSFYVVPRIQDIETIEKRLAKITPNLKYKIVHGGLPATQVDQIMNDFYEHKFDILISTSIIESGIDIATANTMIIHKADYFGLAQLYQLRGRIGRGKIRGFAYLTLEKDKQTNNKALKRLEIMETLDTLGAGFSIATHDMDFRGFGNLIGQEQSGQVKEVGVELYQEMLDEQILILTNGHIQTETELSPPIINLMLPVYIDEQYISDTQLRLGIYRRIGQLDNEPAIDNFANEMIDRFGTLPAAFQNLLDIVKIKQHCIKLSIENLEIGDKGAVFRFYKDSNVYDMVTHFTKQYPGRAIIKPDNKLIFIKNFDKNNIIEEITSLLSQFKNV